MSGQNLDKLVRHKIIKSTDSEAYEKELNNLISSGWQAVNIQSTITWSEKLECFQEFYLAILVKQGL